MQEVKRLKWRDVVDGDDDDDDADYVVDDDDDNANVHDEYGDGEAWPGQVPMLQQW